MKSHNCEWYSARDLTSNEGPVVCEFDLPSGNFAWINEQFQPQQGEITTKNKKGEITTGEVEDHSILKNKKTEAYCKEVDAMQTDLNNGRSCKNSWECVSQVCKKTPTSRGKECQGL